MNLLKLLFALQGRTSRLGFWLFQLGWLAVWTAFYAGLWVYLREAYPPGLETGARLPPDVAMGIGAVFIPLWLLSAWTAFSVAVKRLHDQNRTGFWLLALLIPAVGWAYLLIRLGFVPGTAGPNRFGLPAGEPPPRRPASIVT